ncbi:hypothetical protein ACFL35_09400 [Candidatus Riflebacteria bacterium]
MFQHLKIRTKILLILSSVAIIAAAITGYLGYSTAKNSLKKESFNKLTAIRELKASQVEEYFHIIQYQVQTLSEDRMIIEALRAFKEGFEKIESVHRISDIAMMELDSRLKNHYKVEFLKRLIPRLEYKQEIESSGEKNTSFCKQNRYCMGYWVFLKT